jgi:hypothetical protein
MGWTVSITGATGATAVLILFLSTKAGAITRATTEMSFNNIERRT